MEKKGFCYLSAPFCGYLAAGTKTQGQKNSNSRKFSEKLKENSPKTHKSGNFQKLFLPFYLFATKISILFWLKSPQAKSITRNSRFFLQKLMKFQETQWNFPKTQEKILKNSVYRKVHSPKKPPKRRKKPPVLCTMRQQVLKWQKKSQKISGLPWEHPHSELRNEPPLDMSGVRVQNPFMESLILTRSRGWPLKGLGLASPDYQVGAHFEALDEGVLIAVLKSFEHFFDNF